MGGRTPELLVRPRRRTVAGGRGRGLSDSEELDVGEGALGVNGVWGEGEAEAEGGRSVSSVWRLEKGRNSALTSDVRTCVSNDDGLAVAGGLCGTTGRAMRSIRAEEEASRSDEPRSKTGWRENFRRTVSSKKDKQMSIDGSLTLSASVN